MTSSSEWQRNRKHCPRIIWSVRCFDLTFMELLLIVIIHPRDRNLENKRHLRPPRAIRNGDGIRPHVATPHLSP